MCCFARPVNAVSDTKIFARLSEPKKQMLAYQMQYDSDEQNAMILPIPVASPANKDSVRFISLKEYDDFFKDLAKGYPLPAPANSSRVAAEAIDSKLVVHDVGDFVASFVPTMKDFDRLDQRFVIPKSSWDKIPEYADYGFVVFQLKELRGTPHPMAFEFETRLADKTFFPTVHIHDGEVHEREKFHHVLFMQSDQFDSGQIKPPKGFVRSSRDTKTFVDIKKSQGLVDGELMVHRKNMRGTLANKDVIVASGFKHGGFGFMKPLIPALITLLGLGWIIDRRNRLSKSAE